MKPASEFKTSDERGVYMFTQVKIKDLPVMAMEFAQHLGSKVGLCGEVLISAYASYSEMVEKLPVGDELYRTPDSELGWWAERGFTRN